MSYFTRYFTTYFREEVVTEQPVKVPAPRVVRSRTITRLPRRLVKKRIATPDGPLEVLVPDPFDETDLMLLLAAVAAA